MIRIIALLVSVLASSLAAQSPLFRTLEGPLPFGVGSPDAGADMDGDGDVDLVTTTGLLLNDGNGNFLPAPTSALGFARLAGWAGDLDGDGLRDMVSVGQFGGLRVDVQGPGLSFTQQPAGSLPALVVSTGLTAIVQSVDGADVDGDGDTDLMLRTRVPQGPHQTLVPSEPLLLLNNGSAQFTLAPLTALPVAGFATFENVLEDLDGDGDPDFLFSGSSPLNTFEVFWCRNVGGTFQAPTTVVASGSARLATAEINGDAIRDVVVVGGLASGVQVSVHLGTSGGPGPGIASPFAYPSRLVTLDLDLDGRDELLVSSNQLAQTTIHAITASGSVQIANATLNGIRLLPELPGPGVVSDFDGDGDRDLIALTSQLDPVVFMNDGAGGLVRIGSPVEGSLGARPQVGDINGDGSPDVMTASSFLSFPPLTTLLNDGHGSFTPGLASAPPAGHPGRVLYHGFDRDGDGDMDLYAARDVSSANSGLPGGDFVLDNFSGSYVLAQSLPDHGPVHAVRTVDIDQDGDQDLILGRRGPTTIGNGTAPPMLLLRNLGGTFAPAQTIGGNHATYDVEIADFDQDGDPDILQINQLIFGGADACVLYVNDGSGNFTAFFQSAMTGAYAASGDLNGDQLPDVVLDGQVWLNTGTQSFTPGPALPTPLGAPTTLADADEDGDLDLIESPATLLENLGGGVFAAPVSPGLRFSVAPTSWVVPTSSLADIDQDGDLDILASDGRRYLNVLRHVAEWIPPRIGRPAALRLFGPPGTPYLLYGAPTGASIPLPPFGTVFINPTTAQLIQSGTFTATPSPTAGEATFQMFVPNNPSFVGSSIHWQMVNATPRLSNRALTTIAAY